MKSGTGRRRPLFCSHTDMLSLLCSQVHRESEEDEAETENPVCTSVCFHENHKMDLAVIRLKQ